MYSLQLTFLNALSKKCEATSPEAWNFVKPRNTDVMVMVISLHNLQELSVDKPMWDKRWP